MTPAEESTAYDRMVERASRAEQQRNARPVEAACAECLKKRPVKYDSGLPYCVDDFPEAVE